MTTSVPTTAMILAAGMGKRMRPLTDTVPKPMVPLAGKPLIGHVVDRFVAAGVTRIVVTLHYRGEQIRAYLDAEDRAEIVFSEESDLLETGGGIQNAMPELGTQPFYVANADAFWLNGFEDTLHRLVDAWDDELMEALLLLHSTVYGNGYTGIGDFIADPLGRLDRRPEGEAAPWLFAGVQILHPRLFADAPDGAFSLNVLFDQALANERLYGIIHDGEWFHIGTPEGLADAEKFVSIPFAGQQKRST